jgi:hypothetical protein
MTSPILYSSPCSVERHSDAQCQHFECTETLIVLVGIYLLLKNITGILRNRATDTHSEYVILIPLPWQEWFREDTAISPLYVHELSCIMTSYQGGFPQI